MSLARGAPGRTTRGRWLRSTWGRKAVACRCCAGLRAGRGFRWCIVFRTGRSKQRAAWQLRLGPGDDRGGGRGRAAALCGDRGEGIRSIAVDGWAVDYVRLGRDGEALGDPFCYRDLRTIGGGDVAARADHAGAVTRDYGDSAEPDQHAVPASGGPAGGAEAGAGWLNLPEYLLFRLGGRRVSEQTMAAHGQLVDAAAGAWSAEIFGRPGSIGRAPQSWWSRGPTWEDWRGRSRSWRRSRTRG